MTVRASILTVMLLVGASGCDKIPFIGGGSETPTDSAAADTAQAAAAAVEPAPADTSAAPQTPPAAATPAPPPPAQATALAGEMPYTPTHSGTVAPGMSETQVVGVWGPPAARAERGPYTYLYYRNGCERSCGTFDLVILEGDQVVDAIVRGPGHYYSGVSSSPPNTPPTPTIRDTVLESSGAN